MRIFPGLPMTFLLAIILTMRLLTLTISVMSSSFVPIVFSEATATALSLPFLHPFPFFDSFSSTDTTFSTYARLST